MEAILCSVSQRIKCITGSVQPNNDTANCRTACCSFKFVRKNVYLSSAQSSYVRELPNKGFKSFQFSKLKKEDYELIGNQL